MNVETRQALEKMKCRVVTSDAFFEEGNNDYLSFCVDARMMELNIQSAYLVIGQGKLNGKNTKLNKVLSMAKDPIWAGGEEVIVANARDIYKWVVILPRP